MGLGKFSEAGSFEEMAEQNEAQESKAVPAAEPQTESVNETPTVSPEAEAPVATADNVETPKAE